MAMRTLKLKLTRKQFQEKADQILGRLFREVSAFEDTSEAAKAARRERGQQDIFWFYRTYLPHYFNQPEAPFHHELIEMVDQRPGPEEVLTPVALAAPREFAKTTVLSFGYVLHQIYFKLRHFIIIGSDTEDLASDLTGYLYLEMLYNERLKCDFGEMVRENWGVDDFVTLNDIRLKARGRGQRLVGRKHKQWRPDLIILDDMENDVNSRNPDQVRKLTDWVLNAVYPSIDSRGSLLWIGTIWARKSALEIAVLSEDEPWCHWTRKIYRAFREDGSSLWPARYSVAMLLKQKKAMGTLAFNKQKMNDPKDDEGAFREEWLRYFNRGDIDMRSLTVASFVDPSAKNGEGNDFKAIITVGLDRGKMIYHVLHAWIRRASIADMFAAAYRQHDHYGGQVGIEENMLKDFLHEAIENYALTMGRYLPWKPIDHKAAKESRIIGTLSYLAEHGKLQFEKGHSDQNLLIEQLIYYPSSTVHDDGPDALEGAVKLLQGGAGPWAYESLGKTAFGRIAGAW
jgi:predicted phage terminase large subunit-like protein